MRFKRGEFPGIPTVDVMLGLVIVFIALFRLSILIANAEQAEKKQSHVKDDALFLITVMWPGESDSDIDLYVADPMSHLVYFRRLQDGLMCLNRDDTGAKSNMITMPDGRKVKSAENIERVEIRGVIEGEYVVNVHLYRQDDSSQPVKSIVTLYKVTPAEDVKLHEKVVTLASKGQEETAFRFALTQAGEVADINELPKRFVGTKAAQAPGTP